MSELRVDPKWMVSVHRAGLLDSAPDEDVLIATTDGEVIGMVVAAIGGWKAPEEKPDNLLSDEVADLKKSLVAAESNFADVSSYWENSKARNESLRAEVAALREGAEKSPLDGSVVDIPHSGWVAMLEESRVRLHAAIAGSAKISEALLSVSGPHARDEHSDGDIPRKSSDTVEYRRVHGVMTPIAQHQAAGGGWHHPQVQKAHKRWCVAKAKAKELKAKFLSLRNQFNG